MSTGKMRGLIGTGVLVLLLVAWAGSGQLSSYSAYRTLDDQTFLQTASPAELRRTAEQSLGWYFGNPHLAFEVLQVHADESSIPYIRAALERKPPGDDVTCTWEHAEETLARLGGGAQSD